MKKKLTNFFLLAAGLIILGAVSTALRTVALLTAFDTNIGYFDEGAAITQIDRIVLIIAVVYGAIITATIKKNIAFTSAKVPTAISISFSFASAFAFVMAAALFGIICLTDNSPLNLAVLVSLILSAAYFIYRGVRRTDPSGSPLNLMALFPAAACWLIIVLEMFNMYIPTNAPEKINLTFALMMAALSTIEIAKSDAVSASPRLLLFSMYSSCLLCAYFAIPGLIAITANVIKHPQYMIYYFIAITMLLFNAGALFDQLRLIRLNNNNEE